jgi:hypothetical protein
MTVIQWQVAASVPRISKAYLAPVLEAMVRQFPLRTRGFHSDNDSEFIKETVSKLLDKLVIEQTEKPSPRSGANGLIETEHGAVIRKQIGCATSMQATQTGSTTSIGTT